MIPKPIRSSIPSSALEQRARKQRGDDASGVGRLFGTGPAVPLVVDYGASPITQNFNGTMTFFPLARTVSIADKSKTTPGESSC